ncbi:hypothetical protein QYF61_020356, partial [Mycteria americana]
MSSQFLQENAVGNRVKGLNYPSGIWEHWMEHFSLDAPRRKAEKYLMSPGNESYTLLSFPPHH